MPCDVTCCCSGGLAGRTPLGSGQNLQVLLFWQVAKKPENAVGDVGSCYAAFHVVAFQEAVAADEPLWTHVYFWFICWSFFPYDSPRYFSGEMCCPYFACAEFELFWL